MCVFFLPQSFKIRLNFPQTAAYKDFKIPETFRGAAYLLTDHAVCLTI